MWQWIEADSHMNTMLELADKDFKITRVDILKDWTEKMNYMQGENFISKMEAIEKMQNKKLGLKYTILGIKISLFRLNHRLDRVEERSVSFNTNYLTWNVMRKMSEKSKQSLWDL